MKAQWVIVLMLLLSAATAPATGLQLISRPADAAPPKRGGNGNSGAIVMSPDGRYILFASTANNLLPTNNFNLAPPYRFNVYLRDTWQQTTTLVSVNQNGNGGTGDSFPTGISADGRFVLFESTASDLVANDRNGVNDVFVRDLTGHITQPVDVLTNGALPNPSANASDSALTPDGRYVAFVSRINLTTNNVSNVDSIYVRDLQTSKTVLASLRTPPSSTYYYVYSRAPVATPDGRYVAFFSTASNLISGVATAPDIYVRDLVANTTVLASTNARALFGWTNVFNFNHSISTDGRFVVFETCSNGAPANVSPGMILRHDLQTGATEIR